MQKESNSKLSIQNVNLKISTLPTLAIKSPEELSYGIYRIYRTHVLRPSRNCPSHYQFYPLLGHERSEQYDTSYLFIMYDILSLTN
jgi:hypothetical protein